MRSDSNKTFDLDDWKKGSPLTAAHLQQSHDAIETLTGGVAVPRQVSAAPLNRKSDVQEVLKFVVVRSIGQPTDNFVSVQVVRQNIVDGVWDGTFVFVGEPEPMAVYPGQLASDFDAFLWPTSLTTVNSETPILKAVRVDGAWWLPQYLRFQLAAPDLTIPFGDCTPHIAGDP